MAYMMITVILSLLAGLFTLVYGVGIVGPDILDNPDWQDGYTLFIVIPIFIDLFTISGYALLVYYLLVVGAIIACCTWVFISSYKIFFKELTMRAEPREHSQIFDISGLLFFEIFALLVVIVIAELLGISSNETGVTGTESELLFLLANASVWEELIVRILFIGIPLLLIDLVVRKNQKKWSKYIFGGGFSFGVPEVGLLTFSAMIFGYAHYIGGWEAWVVPWDALGGITFGYLFLRHGLPAAVVLHFAIDYRAMPTEVFGFSQAFEAVLFMMWMALGAVFAIYYIVRVGEFLSGRKYLEERVQYLMPYQAQPVPYQSTQQGAPQSRDSPPTSEHDVRPTGSIRPGTYGGYVCPYCGYTEARWVDGRFQCLRCNRLA